MSGWDEFLAGQWWPQHPAATPATPAAPLAAPPPATGNWWDLPNVQFDANGQPINPLSSSTDYPGKGFHGTLAPPYAVPSWMPDPQTFYSAYQQLPEADRAATTLSLQSSAQTRADTLAGQEAGRGWLSGQIGDVRAAGDSWANDPTREMVMKWMQERANPNYQFFSPTQRAAATLPIGQQYATNKMMSDATAAAHGGMGGIGLQNDAIMRGQAMTGGTLVRSQMDANEQKLREGAIQSLAGTTAAYEGVDQQYLNASNQLAGALASLETGVEFQPTDYTVWPALARAEADAKNEAQWRRDMLDALDKESQWGIQDTINTILQLPGSGIPSMVAGLAA